MLVRFSRIFQASKKSNKRRKLENDKRKDWIMKMAFPGGSEHPVPAWMTRGEFAGGGGPPGATTAGAQPGGYGPA